MKYLKQVIVLILITYVLCSCIRGENEDNVYKSDVHQLEVTTSNDVTNVELATEVKPQENLESIPENDTSENDIPEDHIMNYYMRDPNEVYDGGESYHIVDDDGIVNYYPRILGDVDLSEESIQKYNEYLEAYDEISKRKLTEELEWYDALVIEGESNEVSPWNVGNLCGWICAFWFVEYESSSNLPDFGDNSYTASCINDETIETCWAEGVLGSGIGEYVSMKANTTFVPMSIAIYNGYSKSEQTFIENNRVEKLAFYLDDKFIGVFHLEDIMDGQVFIVDLEDTEEDFTFKFEIVSVYEGSKYDDTCISDIQILDGH